MYLVGAHQKTQRHDRAALANRLSKNGFNNAIFINDTKKKFYLEIDGVRYPEDPIIINYNENSYLNQYRDQKKVL